MTVDESVRSIDAEVVEGTEFAIFDVSVTEHTGFTHFLDGAQRSWRVAYHGLLPVSISHTSAALLQRVDRVVQSPTETSYDGSLEAFVPSQTPLGEVLGTLMHVRGVDTAGEDEPAAVSDAIRVAIETRREERELCLLPAWTEGALLIDGGIGKALRALPRGAVTVGLVKSHQRRYFASPVRTLDVLNMKAGQRTSVFRRTSNPKQGSEAFSFYLRLHERPHEGPMYGIARIEIPPTEAFLARVDEIAGWLLAERAPLSLPDPRSDRLLYPIHMVEAHLKARQPSEPTIRALIGL